MSVLLIDILREKMIVADAWLDIIQKFTTSSLTEARSFQDHTREISIKLGLLNEHKQKLAPCERAFCYFCDWLSSSWVLSFSFFDFANNLYM